MTVQPFGVPKTVSTPLHRAAGLAPGAEAPQPDCDAFMPSTPPPQALPPAPAQPSRPAPTGRSAAPEASSSQPATAAQLPPAPAPAAPDSPSAPAPSPSPDAGQSRRLENNPLFASGAGLDEFALTQQNVDFAAQRFNLDAGFVSLVKSTPKNARFSVVYHSEGGAVKVDAYRTAAAAGKDSVFAGYEVKNPSFDPAKAYLNELVTPLGNNKYFATLVVSKRLAVPDCADSSLRGYLESNGYDKKETIKVSEAGLDPSVQQYLGLPDTMGIDMYQMQKKSFGEKWKVFYDLFKESPEFRALKIGDVLDEVGSAMVLGVITPKLYEQGAAYGVAATMSSIGNIGSPAVGIVGESLLGSVVDKAVNSDRPLENLKKIGVYTGIGRAVKAGATFAMHPGIIKLIGSHPATAFVGLYASTALLGAVTGVVTGKADFAIHDQLINKAKLSKGDYAKNFYQILGVESSISRALYLGSYSATVAAVSAWPGASIPIAAAGAALWGASNFVFPLYHEKPEVKMTIDGGAFVHEGDRYVFDSGWEVEFRGSQGKIIQEDDGHFSISLKDGELYIKNDRPTPVAVDHDRHLRDYLPDFLKPKFLGVKEHWDLSNGSDKINVSRFGNEGFHLVKISDNEYVVTRNNTPEQFWT